MLIDVAVPEMAVDVLTYEAEADLPEGSRVIVEVQNSLHAGLVLARSERETVSTKPIAGVIDARMMFDPDLWDLAVWCGEVSLRGINTALRYVLPRSLWMGEKLDAPPDLDENAGTFREVHNFNPFDHERVNFYVSELEKPERALVLFPSREKASEFYASLPESLKAEAFLWYSLQDWEDWQKVNSKHFRIVIGSAGAVFAPLCPQKIIVDDEASSSYILPNTLRLSARSLAGRRALFLGATLILGGNIPSLKTYMRSRPKQTVKPERSQLIIADIYTSRKEEAHGIDGSIPLTFSLVRRSYQELTKGHNVLWILSRKGESLEVYCPDCGHILRCEKCGGIMRSVSGGEMLKCRMCGHLAELPAVCPKCRHGTFRGRRPGIEALFRIVSRYYPKVKLYVDGMDSSRMKGLVLSGHKGLGLLESMKPSLVAWLDLDAELSGEGYDVRYRVFSMLCSSMYSGVKSPSERKVLVQTRSRGRKFCEYLLRGWERFLNDELKAREEFMMPPCGYMIEIDSGGKITRETIIDILEDNGLFVMDPGDETQPLYVLTDSLSETAGVLAPYRRMLRITVRSE